MKKKNCEIVLKILLFFWAAYSHVKVNRGTRTHRYLHV